MTTTKQSTLKPLADRVLVQRSENKDSVSGGIILPDSAKQKQETAVVIAMGPGKTNQKGQNVPMNVSVGQTILMDKYSGQEVSLNNKDYVVVRSDDIIAIIE